MFDFLTVACVQFMVLLKELQKVLSQELKVFVEQVYHSPTGMNGSKHCGCYIFIVLEVNKYIV